MPADRAVRAGSRPRRDTLVALAAGVGIAAGHAPVSAPWIALPALVIAVRLVVHARDWKDAAWLGWLVGAGHFATALHWIVEPFLVDAARHGWMAPFALVLLAGGLALFWAAGFALAAWLSPAGGSWRRGLALVLALTLAELARSTVFTGFPWALLATIWVDTPLRLLAGWLGPHGLGAATLLVAATLAAAIGATDRARAPAAIAGVSLLALAWAAGDWRAARIPQAEAADAPMIRLVQPNAEQHLKWRADMIPVFWERRLELTALPAPTLPDLVIWPEVALPYLLGSRPDMDAAIAAAARGAPVLAGAQRFDGPRLMNSVALVTPDGDASPVYDKHHLVPFGEYVPGGALAARLGLAGLATDALGGFSPGSGPALVDLSTFGLGHVLPLICYEAIFPRHAFPPPGFPRPDWIVQVTNDGWFGRHAGPPQHLAQARFRAVEQGLPLMRVATTGISAAIDPAGRVRAYQRHGAAGVVDAPLPAPLAPTLYARTGPWPLLAILALATLGLAARRRA